MKLSKPLLVIITLIWFILAIWWYSCSTCCNCKKNQVVADTTSTQTTPVPQAGFLVRDESWQSENNANIRFGRASDVAVVPESLGTNLDSIASHLNQYPDKALTITGFYAASETNNSSFENLGIARAESIKKLLLQHGVKPIAINTASQLIDGFSFVNDTLHGGFNMTFNTIKVDAVTDTDLFEPHTVYFNTGANSLKIDNALQNYLQKADKFIRSNPDKKLVINGYTDNVGNETSNIDLSKKRALFVKRQLAAHGIPEANMTSDGYGSQNPVAGNETPEGRSKNRRVTIEIK